MEASETSRRSYGHRRTAKLFRNGRNQAVRLPREFEIDADEVYVSQEGENLILTPKRRSWDSYFEHARCLSTDYPDVIEDLPLQSREPF